MMDQKQLVMQLIQFNKTSFDNTFNALSMLQDQTERMTESFLEQATWLPQEGRGVINEWVKAFKKGREEFKNQVDQSFERVEAFFEEKK